MPFVDNKHAEPVSECFLVTADTLVQGVMLRHGALRKDKGHSKAQHNAEYSAKYNAKSGQADAPRTPAAVKTAVA